MGEHREQDDSFKTALRKHHRTAVTGAVGLIGSHLVESLLNLDQQVTGLDDFLPVCGPISMMS